MKSVEAKREQIRRMTLGALGVSYTTATAAERLFQDQAQSALDANELLALPVLDDATESNQNADDEPQFIHGLSAWGGDDNL